MSAFMVSNNCIQLLALWAARDFDGRIDFDHATECARVLWRANHDSLSARYRDHEAPADDSEAPVVGPDDWTRLRRYSAVAVIKQAHCYQYQSCEHDGWEGSEARKLSYKALNAAAEELPGYESAEWGIP